MSDNLPAVRAEAAPTVLDTDSWTSVVRDVSTLAQQIAGTGFVPSGLRDNPAAVAAAMLYGREVGLPPMTALGVTHVVEGKPGLSAEAMRMLVFAAGHELEVTDATGARCVLRGRRRGGTSWTEVVWTLDMARAAGVAGKGVWQKYPRAMLLARATTELCRMIFPDVIHGFRSVEELEDMTDADRPVPGAEAPSSSRTRVSRTRAKKVAEAVRSPEERPAEPPAREEVPLPGEEEAGSGSDDPAVHDTNGPEVPLEEPDPADEPVDAEIVPDATDTPGSDDDGPIVEEPRSSPRAASKAQHRMIFAELKGLIDEDRDERLLTISTIIGRQLDTMNDLLHHEARGLIDALSKVKSRTELSALLDELEAQRRLEQADGGGR